MDFRPKSFSARLTSSFRRGWPLGPDVSHRVSPAVECFGLDFELIGEITEVEAIAIGNRIRVLRELTKRYGKGRWRKLKGNAFVRLVPDGSIRRAELHWFEAHGIGRKRIKIKDYLD
jgi:hypothetical protein